MAAGRRRDARGGGGQRRPEGELRDILESISDAFYALDRELRFSYVNGPAAALWDKRPEDLLGKPFLEVFPQHAGRESWAAHITVNETGRPIHLETMSASLGQWAAGSIYPRPGGGVAVYFRGISERKRAEAAMLQLNETLEQRIAERTRALAEANRRLRESEESQRALFQNAPVPMNALDAERRIIAVNGEWLKVFGYARDEVLGRPVADFHQPDSGSGDRHEDRWRLVIESGRLRDVERRYVKKSGETVETLVSAIVERDAAGRFVRVITVLTDVTARRRAERAARRERQLSELLLESSAEGIIGIDRDFRYTVWNPYMEALSGIPRGEILGRTVLEMFPHLRGSPIEAGWREALAGARRAVADWAFSYPQTGRQGFFDQEFAPLHGSDQSIMGAIAFLRDTTERRRMQEQLQQVQKMEALGQLTGGVAHDINNLLMVIAGNLDILRRKIGEVDAARQVRAIERATRRGEGLTRQLLSFARRQALQPKVLDLPHRLPPLIELIRPSLRGDIEIVTDVPSDTWLVEVDPGELELAILNIAVNARDAMPKGGRLALAVRNRVLDGLEAASGRLAGDFIAIAIADTGAGIPLAVLPRIFEPFFTTKEIGKGTGLGLSQVYGFAKQSGGGVLIETAEGLGTTVTLLLPRSRAPILPTRLEAAAQAPQRGSGTILIVEDNDEVAEVTVALLEETGYAVKRASTARQALDMLGEAAPIDLVFSDVIMPGGMNGLDLARTLRRQFPALPVLLTTGYSAAAQEAAAEGFVILAKPFRRESLEALLHSALEGRTPHKRHHSAPERG